MVTNDGREARVAFGGSTSAKRVAGSFRLDSMRVQASTKHPSFDECFVAPTTRMSIRVQRATKHVSIDTCFVETRAFRGESAPG